MTTEVLDSRTRRRAETRLALLTAAEKLFRHVGYADASVDGIAREAGFTKGAVYGLFDSKEDLFLALLDHRATELLGEISLIVPETPNQSELITALTSWLGDRLRQDHDWVLVNAEFSVLAARKPALRGRRAELLAREQSALAQILAPHTAGLDPERVSGLVMAIIDGLVLQASLDSRHDVPSDLAFILERLLRGVHS
ncbi:MAG: regulatory protein TetR [Frankiales bacterium]|nr:regulatory protein TetR [Frankiales bacterium]